MVPLLRWFPVLGFLLTFAWFYPGNMEDPDSVFQFQQAQTFCFDDQHPVAMAVLWSVFNQVWPGPASMLCFQLALYWGAAWLILDRAVTTAHPRALLAVLFLLAAPYTLWFLDEIFKDVQMASAWSFAMALLYHHRSKGRPMGAASRVLVGSLIVYGGLVRNNAGIAAGPLVLFAVTGKPYLASTIRTLAVYLIVAVGSVLLGKGLLKAVKGAPTIHTQLLLYFDLVGISKQSGDNVIPIPLGAEEYRRLLDGFTGASRDDMHFPGVLDDPKHLMVQLSDGQLLLSWCKAVAKHPLSYLAHRARYLKCFLIKRDHETISKFITSLFSRPITWIFFWLVALIWYRRSGLKGPSADFVEAHLVLAMLYLLTYLPFGIAWGWRYVYHVVISVTLVGCVLLSGPRDSESPLDPAETPALG